MAEIDAVLNRCFGLEKTQKYLGSELSQSGVDFGAVSQRTSSDAIVSAVSISNFCLRCESISIVNKFDNPCGVSSRWEGESVTSDALSYIVVVVKSDLKTDRVHPTLSHLIRVRFVFFELARRA